MVSQIKHARAVPRSTQRGVLAHPLTRTSSGGRVRGACFLVSCGAVTVPPSALPPPVSLTARHVVAGAVRAHAARHELAAAGAGGHTATQRLGGRYRRRSTRWRAGWRAARWEAWRWTG